MIVKSIELALAPGAAFELFTARVSDWWPPENRHTADAASTLHLQPEGRFFERASNGHEVELGRVLVWQPPERLVFDFFVATGPAAPTRVEVRFEPAGTGTRVTVTHGPGPASETLWPERAPRYRSAWDRVLAALADHAAKRLH